MKKFIKFIIALIVLHGSLLIVSCGDEVDCGNSGSKFRVTDFFLYETKIKAETGDLPGDLFAASDTISFDSLVLNVEMTTENFALHHMGTFMSSAYACSPPLPNPVDTITSVEIFSLIRNNQGLIEVGERVTKDFDVIPVNVVFGELVKTSLTEFNQTPRATDDRYFFQLNKAPESVSELGYKIIFNFSTRALLEGSSEILYISP